MKWRSFGEQESSRAHHVVCSLLFRQACPTNGAGRWQRAVRVEPSRAPLQSAGVLATVESVLAVALNTKDEQSAKHIQNAQARGGSNSSREETVQKLVGRDELP